PREAFNVFFQAEDGIRDFHVTGVQTCALPILRVALGSWPFIGSLNLSQLGVGSRGLAVLRGALLSVPLLLIFVALFSSADATFEIGRASCREREWIAGVAVPVDADGGTQFAYR